MTASTCQLDKAMTTTTFDQALPRGFAKPAFNPAPVAIAGMLIAAGLRDRHAARRGLRLCRGTCSQIGGLLLGYGARIAYGCNIGAYFSGIASSSVHGWLWFVAAFAGNAPGTRLRPFFGLRV
jgi:hypothetical protein